jgi:hypothetical protein
MRRENLDMDYLDHFNFGIYANCNAKVAFLILQKKTSIETSLFYPTNASLL